MNALTDGGVKSVYCSSVVMFTAYCIVNYLWLLMVDRILQGGLVVSCLLACILVWHKYCSYIGVFVFIVVVPFAGRVAYQHHRARSVEPLGTACDGSISCRD